MDRNKKFRQYSLMVRISKKKTVFGTKCNMLNSNLEPY
jgi:hypothetical protein